MKKIIFLVFATFIFIGCSYINEDLRKTGFTFIDADLRKETAKAIGGFTPDQVIVSNVDVGTMFTEWNAATPKGNYGCDSYEGHVTCMENDHASGKSAVQNEQPNVTGEPVKQNNREEQTTRESTVSQITTYLKDIHFNFDQYSIRPEDRQILSSLAGYLLKDKNVKIVIEGNCDERGTTEYNLALGDRRAQDAMNFLVNSGIDRERIKIISYGKERPLDPDHNEEAWAKNRRDHFVVEQ